MNMATILGPAPTLAALPNELLLATLTHFSSPSLYSLGLVSWQFYNPTLELIYATSSGNNAACFLRTIVSTKGLFNFPTLVKK
jgi:hypothetical protein